ncbi:MAG: hypothetical protein EA390_13060 [Balneolaceae bacterium]|nr:MAG: hypothetical protein EA390_13060 [Balneolaceae bacterium]
MESRNKNFKNNLKGSGDDPLDDFLSRAERKNSEKTEKKEMAGGNPGRTIFLVIVIVLFGSYFFKGIGNISLNPFNAISQTAFSIQQPSEDLLNRMNNRMVEMGYPDLNHDDLRELRSQGVTATYISNVRALGFTELTLEDALRLANANITSTFLAMMIELGYDLSLDEYIQLRRAGVTAHYTSNVHDLGYRDVTPEQLIRMQRIGLTTSLIERLQQERGQDVPLEDVIRHRISNQ